MLKFISSLDGKSSLRSAIIEESLKVCCERSMQFMGVKFLHTTILETLLTVTVA